ncbi:HD domain-containing protein [Paenibacillus solisilvae]|uniref:HD domain-containing protein n=1 Tax=Paenibacillus solisilvae TaxID=2486751 RepID=A0ABW0W209_9BACL
MSETANGQERHSILASAELFVKSELGSDASGHDWWHIHRVVEMAKRIAVGEGADMFICVIAALIHDVADEKLNDSKEAGLLKVDSWLESQPIEEEERRHIMEIISTMSFNAGTNPPMRTLEGKIVQDADRLDAIGAIAIARTFLYAGWKGDPIHDPLLPPRDSMTRAEYRGGRSTAINHFYEKLLKLKDNMNTSSAKRIAEDRHAYMVRYLEQFHQEWEGQA